MTVDLKSVAALLDRGDSLIVFTPFASIQVAIKVEGCTREAFVHGLRYILPVPQTETAADSSSKDVRVRWWNRDAVTVLRACLPYLNLKKDIATAAVFLDPVHVEQDTACLLESLQPGGRVARDSMPKKFSRLLGAAYIISLLVFALWWMWWCWAFLRVLLQVMRSAVWDGSTVSWDCFTGLVHALLVTLTCYNLGLCINNFDNGLHIGQSGEHFSGPHLHFAIQQNIGMKLISLPFRLKTSQGDAIAPEELELIKGTAFNP